MKVNRKEDVIPDWRRKKLKYSRIVDDWGEEDIDTRSALDFLYSGLEGGRMYNKRAGSKKTKKEQELEMAALTTIRITKWTEKLGEHKPEVLNNAGGDDPEVLSSTGGANVGTLALGWERISQGALEWSNMGTPALKWDGVELDPPGVSRKLDNDSNIDRSAGEEHEHQPVTGVKTKTSKAKKVWTKLGNGLYGWRAVRSVGRRTKLRTVNTKPK